MAKIALSIANKNFGVSTFNNTVNFINHSKIILPTYRSCHNNVNNFLYVHQNFSPKFKALDFERKLNSNLKYKLKNEFIVGLPKGFRSLKNQRPPGSAKPDKRVPRLIMIQNPFRWLMLKIDFTVLRRIWDPTFREQDFKYGTKQAIECITNVLSSGHYDKLNGLLTKPARISLVRDMELNWTNKSRGLLALNKKDIQIIAPRKVYFIRIADKKYCDVDMTFLSLKWVPVENMDALLFSEIFARFHRDYTPHSIPEWTIAYFKVRRFQLIKRK